MLLSYRCRSLSRGQPVVDHIFRLQYRPNAKLQYCSSSKSTNVKRVICMIIIILLTRLIVYCRGI